MLYYGMLWYDMTNEILWMLGYAKVCVVKDLLEVTVLAFVMKMFVIAIPIKQ